MVDISRFSGFCSYCYNDSSEPLSICSCGNTLCFNHLELHTQKFGCIILCLIKCNENEKIKIQEMNEETETKEELEIKLNEKKNSFYERKNECSHIKNSKNISRFIDSNKCDDCDINENLWVCIDCGHIGCGRKQEGSVGNGHALEHFDETLKISNLDNSSINIEPHHNSVLLSSINEGNGDVFCYSCNDFVLQPFNLNLSVKDQKLKEFPNISQKSDILGIKNDGENCYISSVLHLINETVSDVDLSVHFLFCESDPLECLCCQFVKIMNEMKNVRNAIKSVRITDFLHCVYKEMGIFKSNNQEDCSEFLMLFLERLSFFEECMLLPKITDRFDFEIKTESHCNKCDLCNYRESKERMINCDFDLSLEKALSKYLKTQINICGCGGEIEEKSYFSKIPEYLILNISRNRFEDMKCVKVDNPIEIGDFKLVSDDQETAFKYELQGCICHKGNEVLSGHYTWWTNRNGIYFVADDSIISKSDEDYPKSGTLFLMRCTDCRY